MNKRDNEITKNILLLVNKDIPISTIISWSDKEIETVEKWARAVIFKASDNSCIKIPKYPVVLEEYERWNNENKG